MDEVLKPQLLLVMAHHNVASIRAAVVKLLHWLLLRSREEQQRFIKHHGVVLLANQLQPYRATPAVVEACLGLCVGNDVQLEQLTDPLAVWPEKPTPFQLQSLLLLLTLLPNATADAALFNQLVSLVRTLVRKSNAMLRFLLELGLVETLARTVVALAHTSRSVKDILEQRQDDVLMDGVHRLLVLVTRRSLAAAGAALATLFHDAVLLFAYVHRVEMALCGPRSRCVRLLREASCVLLKNAVDVLQELAVKRSVDAPPQATPFHNYLTDKVRW